jgi:hypothetical protein
MYIIERGTRRAKRIHQNSLIRIGFVVMDYRLISCICT